jgi:DNA-binding response OmpR family regulator
MIVARPHRRIRGTSPRRVLIVDDEPAIAALLQESVGPDYLVEIASNGKDALAATRRMRPDVVLLDVNMPGMSGVDVLQRIRTMDSSIPVIMVTASSDNQAVADALRLGAFSYVPKPFSVKYIRHLVSAALAEGPP